MIKKLRFIPMICTVLLLLTFAVSAEIIDGEVTEETRKTAYLDIGKQRSADTIEEILKAREEVILTESWVTDGAEAQIANVLTGEIIEDLPEFHELFPEDWDIPVADTGESTIPVIPIIEEPVVPVPLLNRNAINFDTRGSTQLFNSSLYINKAGSTVAKAQITCDITKNNKTTFYPTSLT